MLHRPLAIISFVSCALVLASFAMFANDRISAASSAQLGAKTQGAPRAPAPSQTQRILATAGRALTSPFARLVPARDVWLAHAVPVAIALLVYGFGLGSLVRYLRR